MMVTTSIHNFWLYELCDVFIVSFCHLCDDLFHWFSLFQEAMKPMTDRSVPLTTQKSVQQTLYTCLDYGLRLLHPIMPFVTEELWQRMQRRPNDPTPSIMVSSYPTFVSMLPAWSHWIISCFNRMMASYLPMHIRSLTWFSRCSRLVDL
jgi:valyl-tRNA synthetase